VTKQLVDREAVRVIVETTLRERGRPLDGYRSSIIDRLCALPTVSAPGEAVTEMRICEVPWLQLCTDQLYRFSAAPGCKGCAEAIAGYAKESAAIPNASAAGREVGE
jgi:hypothetical protein